MNKAVPLTGEDVGHDLRDAARKAARDEGKSLSEWLDALMEDRAGALGVSPADLGAEDRLDAVAQTLVTPAARPETFRTADQALADFEADRRQRAVERTAPPSDDGPAHPVAESGPAVPSVGLPIGPDLTRLAPHAAPPASPARSEAAESWNDAAEDREEAASERVPPRSAIEAKLNTLFKALNRSTARPGLPPIDGAAVPPLRNERTAIHVSPPARPAPDRAGEQTLLARTALTPTRTLDQAVAEITERQAILNSAAPPRTPRATRAEAVPPASRSSRPAAPRQSAPGTPPDLFASLKGDIVRMSQRLDVMSGEATGTPVAPAADPAFAEIRSVLDRMKPAQSIDALERRVGDLTSRIDKALEQHVAPDAFEHLSQRIEDVHASITDRLSPQAGAVDAGSIEQVVREMVRSVGGPATGQPDNRSLEALMQRLADKLDEPRQPHVEAELFADLQAQVGKLGERIDRSDAGLAAIVSVERSLGELFSQMEETRDAAISAAENAARTAARDTLRSAMSEGGLPLGHSQRHSDAAVEQVTHDIAELKSGQAASDKRLHAVLNALNATLEKIIDRLGTLEEDRLNPLVPAPDVARSAPAESKVLAAANPLNASQRVRQRPAAGSAAALGAPSAADRERPHAENAASDFLIEPGASRQRAEPGSEAPAAPPPAPAVQPDPATFIAAARRAAQAAAQSAAQDAAARSAEATIKPGRPPAPSAQSRSLLGRAADLIAARRRPLLLAIAGLVVLMGAVQVARLSLASSNRTSVVAEATPAAAVDAPVAAAVEGAPASAKPAPETAQAAPSAQAAAKPVAAAEPAVVASPAPASSLPTLAMGPAANLAKTQAPTGLPAGLRNMAEDGSAAAQFEVGLRLAEGRGVSRDIKTAADWFEKSAKQGLAPAAYRLGSLYEKGLGVSRDPAAAMQWYQKAAEAGNIRAMHNLAVMAAEGATGKSDYVKAASWFNKAAQAGVRDSQFNLAILYARGLGIEQSLPQSYTWFAIAAAQGDTDSATKRDEVAQRLDPKLLADAKKNADQFQAAPALAAANDVTAPAGGWEAVAPRAASAPSSSLKTSGGARISSM